MSNIIREEVLKLMEKKDKIEAEIKLLTAVLDKNGIGVHEPLVDSEGFPLNNIDIYQVRHARQQIICKQNDHKELMKEIENELHKYYSSTSTSHNGTTPPLTNKLLDRPPIDVHKRPFARINDVHANSPASFCGLEKDDLVVEFGSVNSNNFTSIMDIGTVVQHSEGHKVNVKVLRKERFFNLAIVPKKWQGNGLLGCHIVPL